MSSKKSKKKSKRMGMFKRMFGAPFSGTKRKVEAEKIKNVETEELKSVVNGYMWKKSHGLIRSHAPWKKRWFELFEDNTFVWSNEPGVKRNNSIHLKVGSFEIKPLTGSTKDPFCFMIWETKTERRVMKLATQTEAEYTKWINTLSERCSKNEMPPMPLRKLIRKSSSKVQFTSELEIVSDRSSFKGYLEKLPVGRAEGKWQRRYFVLDGVRLLYFKVLEDEKIEKTRCGMVVLTEKSSVETYMNDKDETKKYCFKLETESATLYVNAESRLHRMWSCSQTKQNKRKTHSNTRPNAHMNTGTHWMSSLQKTTENLVEEERESSSSQTTKRGILHFPKVDGVGQHGKWSQRFVVLQGGAMTLYKDDTLTSMRDSFDLTNCAVMANSLSESSRPEGAPSGGSFFNLDNPAWQDLSRHVRAPTEALMWQWVTCLKAAVDRRRSFTDLNTRSMSGGSSLRRKGFMQKSFRTVVHLTEERISGGTTDAMQLVTKALLNFCLDENGDDVTSPSRPKKFKMLDMIPEDSPVAEKEEEKEEEEEERNLSSSMGKNNLNVTILAYGHNPLASERNQEGEKIGETLFDVFSHEHHDSRGSNVMYVYMSVCFRSHKWIVCRLMEDTLDFVRQVEKLRDAAQRRESEQVIMAGKQSRTRPSVKIKRQSIHIDLEDQKAELQNLRDALNHCLSSECHKSAMLMLYFLELAPVPPLSYESSERLLRGRATNNEITSEDVTKQVSDLSELFDSTDVWEDADQHPEPLRASIVLSSDESYDIQSSKICMKVWEIVRHHKDERERRSFRTFHFTESELEKVGQKIQSCGLPVPKFPRLYSRHSKMMKAREDTFRAVFGKGDLPARLIKMFFDEMPVRLLEPVQKEALSLAEIAKSSHEIQDEACEKCVEQFGKIHPEGKSLLLWLLDLICMIARNEDTTKMGHYGLAVVFAPNIVPVSSDEKSGEIDPLKAQMAFNVAVRSLEQLSMWRQRTFVEHEAKRKQEDIIQGTIDRDEFGISLESCTKEYVVGYENQIPSILVRLKEALELVGGTKKLGIFRVSPSSETVGRTRDLIASGDLFGGVITHHRKVQQYVNNITKHYYGLNVVLDFLRVKDTETRSRLNRLFWLSTACSIRALGERISVCLLKFHRWELSYEKNTPEDAEKLTGRLAEEIAKIAVENKDTQNKLRVIAWQLWALLRNLFETIAKPCDSEERDEEEIMLGQLGLDEISGKLSLIPSFVSGTNFWIDSLRSSYKVAKKNHLRSTDKRKSAELLALDKKKKLFDAEKSLSESDLELDRLCVGLKLVVMLRLLSRQLIARQDSKAQRESARRQRMDDLRAKKKAPSHIDVTQFLMLHTRLVRNPWSWITSNILIGVMPIKTSLNQASKIIQECAKRCNNGKSLGLVVSVASEEELAGLNIALDPVMRQDWEENGVEHLRISLGKEKSTERPNVKKSKKRKAVSWAAELTTAVRKIKKCVHSKSCVYVHDTIDENGAAWVTLMAYLTTYGNYGYDTAKAIVQKGRSRIKPTPQQEQRVRAFGSYFEALDNNGE